MSEMPKPKAQRRRVTMMIPLTIEVEKPSQVVDVYRSLQAHGFTALNSYGEYCYSWKARFDKVKLRDLRAAFTRGAP